MMDDEMVTIHVGKNGITEPLLEEIRSVIKKRKKVRVKMLKTSLQDKDKHELADQLKRSCKAKEAKLIGHTLTLTK